MESLATLGHYVLGDLSEAGVGNTNLALGDGVLVEGGNDLIGLLGPVLASKGDSEELDDEGVLVKGEVVNVSPGNGLGGVEGLGNLAVVGAGGVEGGDMAGRAGDKILLLNGLDDKLLAGGALCIGDLAVWVVGISGADALHVVKGVVVPDTGSALGLVTGKETHINCRKSEIVNLLRLVSNNTGSNRFNRCINGTNVLGVHFF